MSDLCLLSILSGLSKVIEKVMNCLGVYINNHNLISSNHSIFRSEHSCTAAFSRKLNDIKQVSDLDYCIVLVVLNLLRDQLRCSLLVSKVFRLR